jgi:catechol 2,3-dioxygenase-like lactoylglutathione lyase family enzyme
MFDHVTLRVDDVAAAERAFAPMLAALGIEQTASTPDSAAWGDFALARADAEHPATRRAHVALVAPSPEAVGAFWQAGVDAGLADNGPAGPRPIAEGYYAAFLLDGAGNNIEAVRRDGHREGGNVDHVALRVADVAAATAFYRPVAEAAALDLPVERADRAMFVGRAAGGLLSLVDGPPSSGLELAFGGDRDAAYGADPDGNTVEVVGGDPS